MKYQASLPEHNDNISHEHPLKDFVLILLGLSLAVLAGIWALGLLVDRVVDGMSLETEARLTRLIAPPLPSTAQKTAPREAWLQSQLDALRRCAGVPGRVVIAAATILTGDGSWTAGVLAPARHLGESRYSRERESQADAKALQILQCRYRHVGGATEFFEALRKQDGDAPAFAHYLVSHPSMAARIAALQLAMRQAGLHSGPVLPLPR